jgi:hypothetical protein
MSSQVFALVRARVLPEPRARTRAMPALQALPEMPNRFGKKKMGATPIFITGGRT